jgi:hypothetical protein
MLLARGERGPGDTLAVAMSRTRAAEAREERDTAASALDPDEFAANLISRGYRPGMLSQLALRLADVTAELEAERSKIEKGERVGRRVHGMLERGQVGAMDASAMLDGDYGDAHRAEQLERRAGSLRQQLAEASAASAPPRPPQLDGDGVEASASRARAAHQAFIEVTREQATRARMTGAADGTPRRERRPFADRGGVAGRSESCIHCVNQGVSDDISYLLHSDPELNLPTTSPEQLAQLEQAEQAAGRYQPAAGHGLAVR